MKVRLPVTKAIWRNPPAVKGRIHDVIRPSAKSEPLEIRAVIAPAMPIVAVPICAFAASHRPKPKIIRYFYSTVKRLIKKNKNIPARRRIAKSATSCGIS